jgi:hypothetical protein
VLNRLETQLHRLYPPADDGTRALVLQLAGSGAWGALGQAWRGVQADLQLPPPAIAVAGREGYQLWFSLAQTVPAGEASKFLAGLRRRYLPEIPEHRIVMVPADGQAQPLPPLPPRELGTERWSAFVAPDLAALFSEETWLDLSPSPDAQAELLSRLPSIQPAEWTRALQQLLASPVPVAEPRSLAAAGGDPRQFLLDVMKDRSVDLALRIEAAKALLPYSGR